MDPHEIADTPRFGDESPLFRWADAEPRDVAAGATDTRATRPVETLSLPMTPAMRAALQQDTWYTRMLAATKNLVGPVFGPYVYLPMLAAVLVGMFVLMLVVAVIAPAAALAVLPVLLIVIAAYAYMIRSMVKPSHWSRRGRAAELAEGVFTRLGGPLTLESRTQKNGTAVSVIKLGDHEILQTKDDALLTMLDSLEDGYADYSPRTAFLFAIRDRHGDPYYSGPHYVAERVPHIAPDVSAPAATPTPPPASAPNVVATDTGAGAASASSEAGAAPSSQTVPASPVSRPAPALSPTAAATARHGSTTILPLTSAMRASIGGQNLRNWGVARNWVVGFLACCAFWWFFGLRGVAFAIPVGIGALLTGFIVWAAYKGATNEQSDQAAGTFTRYTGPFTVTFSTSRYGAVLMYYLQAGSKRLVISPSAPGASGLAHCPRGVVDYAPLSGDVFEVRDEQGNVVCHDPDYLSGWREERP